VAELKYMSMKQAAERPIRAPATYQDCAAIATNAVEERLDRVWELLRSFDPSAINAQGFYVDSASRARDLDSAGEKIRQALQIYWPHEDDALVDETDPPVSQHIQKLRVRCTHEIRRILANLVSIEGTVNDTEDSRQLAATMRRLIDIN
jgi:hypothetical protein